MIIVFDYKTRFSYQTLLLHHSHYLRRSLFRPPYSAGLTLIRLNSFTCQRRKSKNRPAGSAESIDAMSMSSSHAAPSHDAYAQSEAKRRRLRKGTHSCWECKRRKIKCIFDPPTNATTTCNGCRRRGSQCVSQEFPEVVSFSVDNTITTPSTISGGEGVVRVESRYAGRDSTPSNGRTPTTPPSEDGRRADYGTPIRTPVSMIEEPSRHLTFYTSSEVRMLRSLVMIVTDTAFISIAPSRKTFFNPRPIRQPN